MRVSRGLLATEAHGILGAKVTKGEAIEKADKMIAMLQTKPAGDYAWKEAWSWFKRYSTGMPDLRGHRLDLKNEKAVKKCKVVARVCYRASRPLVVDPTGAASSRGPRVPDTPLKWAHLRSALASMYRGMGYE